MPNWEGSQSCFWVLNCLAWGPNLGTLPEAEILSVAQQTGSSRPWMKLQNLKPWKIMLQGRTAMGLVPYFQHLSWDHQQMLSSWIWKEWPLSHIFKPAGWWACSPWRASQTFRHSQYDSREGTEEGPHWGSHNNYSYLNLNPSLLMTSVMPLLLSSVCYLENRLRTAGSWRLLSTKTELGRWQPFPTISSHFLCFSKCRALPLGGFNFLVFQHSSTHLQRKAGLQTHIGQTL